ncbi:MAG TPA: EVE domain-containing protein [Gammaproteobacteria bacterium]
MSYWLMKSEPGTFSVDDLARSPGKRTHWDGVRNFQARNFMRDRMRRGDRAFFYHSSCPEPGIYGIVEIVREAYADPTQFDPRDDHYDPASSRDDPRWYMVDVKLLRRVDPPILLSELRRHQQGALADLVLLKRGNRLSITPVTEDEWNFILGLERGRE